MLALAPASVLLLITLGDTHARWTASVRNEVRARSPYVGEPVTTKAVPDLEVAPLLGAILETGRLATDFVYTPSFRLRDPNTQARLDHSHRLALGFRDRSERRFRPYLTATFAYGVTDTYSIATQQSAGTGTAPAPTSVGVIPQAAIVRDIQGDISGGADVRLTPLMTLGLVFGGSRGGGADQESRAILPLQTVVRGEVRLAQTITRRDTVAVAARVRSAVFSNDNEARTGEVAGTYRRQLWESTALEATAGAALAFGRPNLEEPEKLVGLPLLGLTVSHVSRWGQVPVNLYIGALMTPFIDRFVGTVYERLEGFGGGSWTLREKLVAQLRGGVSRALDKGFSQGFNTGYAEIAVGYEGARWWRVDFIGRGSRVESISMDDPAVSVPAFQWAAGLSVTFRGEGAL